LNPNFEYYATFSTTAAGSNPNIGININIDCPLATCPASSNVGFFDIAVTQYTANVHSCGTGDATPGCSGTKPAIDAKLGTSSFQLNTNIIAADLPNNVNATTGKAAACGGPGTTTLTSVFDILNGALDPTQLVSGKDGADADTLPDTQADVNPANGAPDGADKLPDYIQLLFTSQLPLVNSRGYGIAVIVASQAQTDVNFLTIDLTVFGAGYAAVTTLGDVRPATTADLNAGQSTQTCTPFTSTVTTLGVSVDNPATGAVVEAAQPTRALTSGPIHYGFDVSSSEDVDLDGVPLTQDRCDNPDVGAFPAGNGKDSSSGTADTDGDGLGNSCDPDSGTADNCPGVASIVKSAACNAAGANPATYPTKQGPGCIYGAGNNTGTATCPVGFAWDPDQDIDGDTHANWSDNCPLFPNPAQIDLNSDGIGDDCQVKTLTALSPITGNPLRPQNDDDDFCDAVTSVGGPLAATTTCYANTTHDTAHGILNGVPTAGIAQDSNDDGFPDFLTIPGLTLTDKNSDSDWDGCSDFAETSGGAGAGACGPSFGAASPAFPATGCGVGIATCLNAKKSNTNGLLNNCAIGVGNGTNDVAHCLDGNKDDPSGSPKDWIDLANDSGQTDNSLSPLAGSTDSDNDGCSNRREGATGAVQAAGGNRDATNRWDFYDVDLPVAGVLVRNKVVNINDTIAILAYIGTNSGNPFGLNASGKNYGGDENLDGVKNFEIFDRSPGVAGMTGAPSGAVNINDAIANLAQIGANCSTS
jgi:hypothetical protein